VDDIYETCERIRAAGGTISREPGPVLWGTTEIAFVRDPDNYAIELIQNSDAEAWLGN
jgi:lactoylglutathione lyase